MSMGERIRERGDRIQPPDDLGQKLRDGAGRLTFAIANWFKQTGNKPAACTITSNVSATAQQLTITITVTSP